MRSGIWCPRASTRTPASGKYSRTHENTTPGLFYWYAYSAHLIGRSDVLFQAPLYYPPELVLHHGSNGTSWLGPRPRQHCVSRPRQRLPGGQQHQRPQREVRDHRCRPHRLRWCTADLLSRRLPRQMPPTCKRARWCLSKQGWLAFSACVAVSVGAAMLRPCWLFWLFLAAPWAAVLRGNRLCLSTSIKPPLPWQRRRATPRMHSLKPPRSVCGALPSASIGFVH